MIQIKINKILKQSYPLMIEKLLSKPYKVYYNALSERDNITQDHRNISGVYLFHNLVNGKQYVGSGVGLSTRLSNYFHLSKLVDQRHISNSILKYGHDNFSVVILEMTGSKGSVSKSEILSREQYYIDLYKPIMNINPIAGSSLGFKHTEESKKLIAESKMDKPLSEETRLKLSVLFSGELNPFWGKTHNNETLEAMKLSKLGELNPMFGKEKSPEFIEQMYKDKSGSNNPMFGKSHSEETLTKLRKKVYVYDVETKELIHRFESITEAKKELKMGYDTLEKYCKSNKVFKNKIFSYNPLELNLLNEIASRYA